MRCGLACANAERGMFTTPKALRPSTAVLPATNLRRLSPVGAELSARAPHQAQCESRLRSCVMLFLRDDYLCEVADASLARLAKQRQAGGDRLVPAYHALRGTEKVEEHYAGCQHPRSQSQLRRARR